ncbi:Antithrombin-III [Nymphon striatum]|nr:Antithrombin-III [Nymphon striatum]
MVPVRIFFFVATVAILWRHTQASCVAKGESPGSKSPNLTDLSNSILQYALKQYKNMITKDKYQDKNIFMSPYSIWSALMLTYLGARGPSSQEIGSLLELEGFDKSGLEEQNSKLNDLLKSRTRLNVFKMANKIAFDKKVVLKECMNYSLYSDQVESVDFSNYPITQQIKLNNWVKKQTGGRIRRLLGPGSITHETLISIINAVYFKGRWKNHFSKQPSLSEFTSSNGRKMDIEMMESYPHSSFGYGKDFEIGAEFVDMPYENEQYSMFLILPDTKHRTIDEVIQNLSLEKITSISEKLIKTTMKVRFPKFKMSETYNLKSLLQDLGMKRMFESFDLSAMVHDPQELYVSQAFHKAFIKMDELGTEAGAATAILASARMFVPSIDFNRPFAFLLREKSTNTILFMGVVKQLDNKVKYPTATKIYRATYNDVIRYNKRLTSK